MKVLIVDDDVSILDMLSNFLESIMGLEVSVSTGVDEAIEMFRNDFYPLIITDLKMPKKSGIDLLDEIKKLPDGEKTKVLLISAFADLNSAMDAWRKGAYDYLFKPFEVEKLYDTINNIIDDINKEKSKNIKDEQDSNPDGTQEYFLELDNGAFLTIGNDDNFVRIGIFSKKMSDLVNTALKYHEDRTISVLIEGESGTGKEIIANLIHHGLKVNTNPFVTINCSAISANLFESEIFGYEPGSFTGANRKGMKGKLEAANGGTIFFDEIGDMPLDFQPKLLRVLQEKAFYRIGGTQKIPIDIQIISATNKPLKQLAEAGKFRWDLYYRLNSAEIVVPPLNDLEESIAPLAQMFLNDFSEIFGKRFRSISPQAIELLRNHVWKGNIRELRNTIHRVILLYDEIELRPKHLQFLDVENEDLLRSDKYILNPEDFQLPADGFDLKSFEETIMKKALEKFKGNKTLASKYLNISRYILYRKGN
ncbi:MAG: sigma-54 dependent transcriptional regulator [FCB group bacterium]